MRLLTLLLVWWCFGFCFCRSFDVFGALLDAASLLLVVCGVSADVVDALVDAACRFMEVFSAVLSPQY